MSLEITQSYTPDLFARYQPKRPIQTAVFQGGGIRAYASALLLQEIASRVGDEAEKIFDFMAGTSAGALNACLLLIKGENEEPKYKTSQLADLIKSNAPIIFHESYRNEIESLEGYAAPLYRTEGLTKVAKNLAGDIYLKDLLKPVLFTAGLMPTRNITQYLPYFFTKRTDGNVFLPDILEATTAAPTYFPEKILNGNCYVDGGMVANDPSPYAYAEIVNTFACGNNQIMVSLGTGKVDLTMKKASIHDMGVFSWAPKILTSLFDYQQNASKAMATSLLGKNFYSIEVTISSEHAALDDISPANIQYLEETTQAWIENHDKYLRKLSQKLKPQRQNEIHAVAD